MTSMPAGLLSLKNRGVIRAGSCADVVIFEENEVLDRSTIIDPAAQAEGIRGVLVNGQVMLMTEWIPVRVLVK